MSKRFLKLFALSAILVMTMASVSFAAAAGHTATWKGGDGSWGDAGKWAITPAGITVPDATTLVVFPESTGTVRVESNAATAGAIRVDGGIGNAVVHLADGAILTIAGAVEDASGLELPDIEALGNVKFTGTGKVVFTAGVTLAAPTNDDHLQNYIALDTPKNPMSGALPTITFDVLLEDTAPVGVVKSGPGTVEFTYVSENKWDADTEKFIIRDGVVAMTRADHLTTVSPTPDALAIIFDTRDIAGRTPTLKTLWTGTDTFKPLPGGAFYAIGAGADALTRKITAETNGGVIDVSVEGSKFVLAANTGYDGVANSNIQPVVKGYTDKAIAKAGAGALALAPDSAAVVGFGIWGMQTHLRINEGEVIVNFEGAFESSLVRSAMATPLIGYYPPYNAGNPNLETGTSTTNVTVAEGTKLSINKNQLFGAVTGKGNIAVAERYFIYNSKNATFDGIVSGYGGVKITTAPGTAATLNPTERTVRFELTGNNTYEGDTEIIGATLLKLSGANNIGGQGKFYLRADIVGAPGGNEVNPLTAGALWVTDNMALHNEFYIDAVNDNTYFNPNLPGTNAQFNHNASVFIVPMDTRTTETPLRLEIAGNVTYAYNSDQLDTTAVQRHRVAQKYSEGLLVLSAQGYRGKAGNLAMFIENGTVRVTENLAFGLGDVWVGAGSASKHPLLSAKNGLNIKNNVYFDRASGFATEIKEENKGASAKVAVLLGDVTGSAALTPALMDVKVDFDSVKSVNKNDIFRIFEARGMNQYEARNVKPTVDNTIGDKAPFDPFISTLILEFRALSTVDVPVLGDLTSSTVTEGGQYQGTIPVTSLTGLKAGSVKVTGASWLKATISGTNIILTGTVPAGFETATVAVSVTTNGDLTNDVLGYESTRYDYVVKKDGSGPAPVASFSGRLTAAPSTVKPSEEIVFTVGSWTFTPADGTAAITLPYDDASIVYGVTGGQAVVLTGVAATLGTYDLTKSPEIPVVAGTSEGTVTLTVNATYNNVVGKAVANATISTGVTPGPDPDDDDDDDSSGCDAGFAGLALLLAAPLFLRKKD